MADVPRLNGAIRMLEQGKPAFAAFTPPEVAMVQAINAAPLDAVVLELEHNPYDIAALRNSLQFMLDRRQIAGAASLAPKVTPIVRIPANGGEMNQFLAKQVLDAGAYGVIWPHVSTVEEARNAVAACRYPRPPGAAGYDPTAQRGDGPKHAATYWGLTQQEYYARADVWPLAPEGEILVGIMCEEVRAVKNLPRMLSEVPGIGFVLIGEGDLSQELGYPRQYGHPALLSAIAEIVAICKAHDVVCGHPHVDANNVEPLLRQGFRWLMPAMAFTFPGLDAGLRAAGRAS
jgi:4-hydroxy-2-oxoheptanedioate aldolase